MLSSKRIQKCRNIQSKCAQSIFFVNTYNNQIKIQWGKKEQMPFVMASKS